MADLKTTKVTVAATQGTRARAKMFFTKEPQEIEVDGETYAALKADPCLVVVEGWAKARSETKPAV